MAGELTTRDVFQQVDARLTRVEDDLRQLRTQTNTGFAQLTAQFTGQIGQLNQRVDQLQGRVTGLFVLTWVTVIGSIWLIP